MVFLNNGFLDECDRGGLTQAYGAIQGGAGTEGKGPLPFMIRFSGTPRLSAPRAYS